MVIELFFRQVIGLFEERYGFRMIYGIGADIVEVSRLEQSLQKSDTFLKRFFTEKEQELILARTKAYQTAAMNFAGKEAVSKAFRTGITSEVHLEEIEILREETGAPYVTLYGKTLEYVKSLGVNVIHISLSDTKEYAIAYAIAECRERT